MDLTVEYCPERKRLEKRSWNLVSRLAVLTERLMMFIGKDHSGFMTTKSRCADVKRQILESNDRLLAHRSAHGC